jgi:oligo-1,6-glucosidase
MNPIVVYGDYQLILPEDESIFAYTRSYENEKLLVVTNFSRETVPFSLPNDISLTSPELIISNYFVDQEEVVTSFDLRPFEARVYKATV